MKISQAGIDAIKRREGWSAGVYKDSAGLRTIGYGHLIRQGEVFTTITPEQGEQLLRADLLNAEDIVRRYVPVPLTQNQYDALVSLAFNVGTRAFINANGTDTQLRRALIAKDYSGAAQKMQLFAYAGGVLNRGLASRRMAEAQTFLA